jgi:hypothetical protein
MVTPQTILANIGMHMNEVGNIVQYIQKHTATKPLQKQCTVTKTYCHQTFTKTVYSLCSKQDAWKTHSWTCFEKKHFSF